jgi:hypothetical protein
MAFRTVVSVLVRFAVRSFSTNSRPTLRAAACGGRPRSAAPDRVCDQRVAPVAGPCATETSPAQPGPPVNRQRLASLQRMDCALLRHPVPSSQCLGTSQVAQSLLLKLVRGSAAK